MNLLQVFIWEKDGTDRPFAAAEDMIVIIVTETVIAIAAHIDRVLALALAHLVAAVEAVIAITTIAAVASPALDLALVK